MGSADATPFGDHADPVRSVAFSRDGSLLASGGQDGVLRIWKGILLVAELADGPGGVRSVAFSPDGAILATSGDAAPRRWNLSGYGGPLLRSA